MTLERGIARLFAMSDDVWARHASRGALAAAFWPMLLGAVLVYAGKMWFLDRMVWLFEDMHATDPRCRGWLY